MTSLKRGTVGVGLGLAAVLMVVSSCSTDPDSPPGGSGNISDPATFQAFAESSFIPGLTGVVDGISRLVVAASGGPADGVIITPTGPDNFTAVIDIDLTGDGSRETTVSGTASGDIVTGATLSITGITTTEPSTTVSFSAIATATGPTNILMNSITANMAADPPGSGNAATVLITSGTVGLDLLTGTPDGFMDCEVSGEGEELFVLTTFQPDGQGGWQAQFTGEGLDFTVP